jgi:hypothetical protein
MNHLPNAHLAVVDERKITEYLLAATHPAGRTKAAFLGKFGFQISSWRVLSDALLVHASLSVVSSVVETEFGRKYSVDGMLSAPDGRKPFLRVIWFITRGDDIPRLVTAYPIRGGEE